MLRLENVSIQRAFLNEPGGIRTHDLRIKSPLLYQLSYELEHVFF